MKFWICRCKRLVQSVRRYLEHLLEKTMSAFKVFVFCVLIVLFINFILAEEDLPIGPENPRDRRTIDSVLRGVADIFGYDVQRRPTAIPPSMAPAPAMPPAMMPAAGR